MNINKLKKSKNIRQIDQIDTKILNILSENSREKLTSIARKIGLSIDATKKRIKKLEKNNIIKRYTIQVNVENIGIPLTFYIYIKLSNVTQERLNEMINFLKKNPRIIDVISVLGSFDLFIVAISKDPEEMNQIKMQIKEKFRDIIADWNDAVATILHKWEEYKF
ncbi:MAG: AsnC family transcriptional regulator [Candidatus Aenigmarchaeota archaeon]|nr:AsnC family transcriptional regulator [Candidatus Aenigmarchaeota archaeon]